MSTFVLTDGHGNPHAHVAEQPDRYGLTVAARQVSASLAVAHEQRTATLVALLSVPGLDQGLHERVLADVTDRLGLDPHSSHGMTTHFDEHAHPRDPSGKFATKPASESDTDLVGAAHAKPLSEGHRLLLDGLVKTHGEDEVRDTVEGMDGYDSFDTPYELNAVGNAMSAALDSEDGRPRMEFGLDSDSDGAVDGYTVTARFYDSEGNDVPLSSSYDIKHSTADREATGEAAAVGYADSLYGDYTHLETLGNRLGLSPDRPDWNMDDNAPQKALAAAKKQMDAGRVAYEVQVAEQVGRDVRAALPESGGYDLDVHPQRGNYYVSRVVGKDGSTLWDESDGEHLTAPGVSDETWAMLTSSELSPATAPEGSPLATKQLRW